MRTRWILSGVLCVAALLVLLSAAGAAAPPAAPAGIPGLPAAADWTAGGAKAGAGFGDTVTAAGDVNGDGYEDVLVGAPFYSTVWSNGGRVDLYLGSAAGLGAAPVWTVEGGYDCHNPFCNIGRGIGAAGDVNGDGYDDVIVAANRWSNGQNDEGRAFVYYGSAAGLRATADWSVESNQADAYLGFIVGTAGDVNGDGYDDVIMGAGRFDNGQTDEGRAFVFLGSAAGLSCGAGCPVDATAAAAWTAESDQSGAELGFPVSTAGDVNGDGYDDVLVGARLYDGAFTDEGKVWVYLGSASGLANTAAWSVTGGQASTHLGPGSGAAGDVNGDGFDDVLVAAHLYDNGQADEGRVLLYPGSAAGLAATPVWSAEGDQAGAQLGYSHSSRVPGDLDGDGFDDVVVGAFLYDQSDEGRAFVYMGSPAGLGAAPAWTAKGNQAGAMFGQAAGMAGDVNRDGFDDLLIGAPAYDLGDVDHGVAFAYYSQPATLAASTDRTLLCGAPATVKIDLANAAALYGYQFTVSYDAAKATAEGAFVNSFFDTTTHAYVPPDWDADCTTTPNTCQFAATRSAPGAAVSGSGTLAQITFTGKAPGTFDVTIGGDAVLADIDGEALARNVAAPLHLAVCGAATVSGKITLQGRSGNNKDPGTVTLTDVGGGGDFPPAVVTFSDTDGSYAATVPVMPGAGSSYRLNAAHLLYLTHARTVILTPGAALTDQNTRLWGGDANNSGGVTLADLSCIGGSFGLTPGDCGGTGSADINADGLVNVQDLAIAGGNLDKSSPMLVVTRAGSGTGTVTSLPAGISCGATCSAWFDTGGAVTLTAAPGPDSVFSGWSGACTGMGACAVTLDSGRNVTATFTRRYALAVTKLGSGGGSVASSPTGIACGSTCWAVYDDGTPVTLTATPDGTSTFAGWAGACSGTGSCTVTMDAAKSVGATFTRIVYALTVTKLGTGGGLVESNLPGITCGSWCSASYVAGTPVTLTATPNGLSTFTGWAGACAGTSLTCTVTMDAAKSVSATFTRRTYLLTVTRTGGGAVTSVPAGIACGATCAASFDAGSSVTLTAAPDPGANFVGWTGACSGTGSCTVTMSSPLSVAARFSFPLNVTKAGAGGGMVTSSPAGISCGSTCSASFDAGTPVTLTATPDSMSTFAGWAGACSGTGACTVTMDAAKSVSAAFTRNVYAFTVTKLGSGGGSVASDPAGISCGSTCSASFVAGTLVTLAATPDSTSTFAGWSGACTGTGSCTVAMDAAKSVSATFTRNTYLLTVTRTGGGSVTSDPAGIACGATCSAGFDAGSSVTLTATPDPGATFAGWTGACSGTSSCTVTMSSTKSVAARFTFRLSVNRAGAGVGTVTSSPAGIDCGTTCTGDYDAGTPVTLTAAPDSTSTFAGWSGACTGTGACTVTMDAAKSVTATFTRNTHLLTVTRTGGGAVTSAPAGIACGATCSASFDAGSSVTLTAAPDLNATFMGWTGACSGLGSCTVTMSAARSVSARFTFPLLVYKAGTGFGTVIGSPPPGAIVCGSTCAASFDGGTAVTLTAIPSEPSTFAGWTGACVGTGSCVVTMDALKSVTATFNAP